MMILTLCTSIMCNILLTIGFIWKYREADRDDLTRLINYKSFIRKFNKYVRYATKRNIPMAILFIDIDHFKKINDHYSHMAGDQAIKTVGQRLNHEIKSTDLLARYGGEEFLICLKNCTLPAAKTVACRILRSISANPLQIDEHSIQLTVSIGIASYPETAPDNLLRFADYHMYEAKRKGRNQMCAGN